MLFTLHLHIAVLKKNQKKKKKKKKHTIFSLLCFMFSIKYVYVKKKPEKKEGMCSHNMLVLNFLIFL